MPRGYDLSPAHGAPATERQKFASGYNNTTTTINIGVIVARDIFNTTDGAAFIPCVTGILTCILGVAKDTIAPGGGTTAGAATGEYTDAIISEGICMALVQFTTADAGVCPGDKLIPATGGKLAWSAVAAAAVSQPNFVYAGNSTSTSASFLAPVVVNLP